MPIVLLAIVALLLVFWAWPIVAGVVALFIVLRVLEEVL